MPDQWKSTRQGCERTHPKIRHRICWTICIWGRLRTQERWLGTLARLGSQGIIYVHHLDVVSACARGDLTDGSRSSERRNRRLDAQINEGSIWVKWVGRTVVVLVHDASQTSRIQRSAQNGSAFLLLHVQTGRETSHSNGLRRRWGRNEMDKSDPSVALRNDWFRPYNKKILSTRMGHVTLTPENYVKEILNKFNMFAAMKLPQVWNPMGKCWKVWDRGWRRTARNEK